MILNYLDELKLYLDKKELTPPDKEARKEIVNNIEDEIKNLLSRIDGLSNASISRSYKSGLNLFLRFPNSTLHITLSFNESNLKLYISSPLSTEMLFPDLSVSINSKVLDRVSGLYQYIDESEAIFYETVLELDENYENNLLVNFIELVEHFEHFLKEISLLSEKLNISDFFYFDIDTNLLVDIDEFEKLFNPLKQNINYSEENEKLFSKLKTNPNDNQTKLIIAHLNMPLAFKYIYPYKSQLTDSEIVEIYRASISAFLACIDKYEPRASFAYYATTRLFANISRCKSQIIRKRIYKNYQSQPTFHEIDNYIKDFRAENNNQYPNIDNTVDYFTPVIKSRLKEKKLKEKSIKENEYLKSAIPNFYHLVTGKETSYKDREAYKVFAEDLNKCINYILEEKEEFIIRNRYLYNLGNTTNSSVKTLEEVAIQLSLTRERVRQIEKKALLKLKSIWTYVVPFDEYNFEGSSSTFFKTITPTYTNRSKEVRKLVNELERNGYFYKGLLSFKKDFVLETGKNLKIENLALKKYINFLFTDLPTTQKPNFQPQQNQITLDTELRKLKFSVRAINVFEENRIYTLRDLISYTEDDLMFMTNFGKTSLNEVKKKLETFQLELSKPSFPAGIKSSLDEYTF